MRSALAASLFVAACGPSADADEPCTPEDVVTSGALVSGPEREDCSPCGLEASHLLLTLETTCEAGVDWRGSYRIIDYATAENLATGERFMYEVLLGQPAEQLWRVEPGEPLEWPGPNTDELVPGPGDYSFRIELLYDLTAAEFEQGVE
jgi:hypothetical protein